MNEYLPYISLGISIIGLIINYIVFSDDRKKSEAATQKLISNLESDIKIIYNNLHKEEKFLDKIDNKLDKLQDELNDK
jgi:peptidoglycan hydrolase CwlO-like protein